MAFSGKSSDIPTPLSTKQTIRSVQTVPIPAFSDLSKAANDVKLKAPNGTNITVKGKQSFDGVTTGQVEGKYALKPQGMPPFLKFAHFFARLPAPIGQSIFLQLHSAPVPFRALDKIRLDDERESARPFATHPHISSFAHNIYLTYRKPGVTITQGWTTAALLDTKIEFADLFSQPVKAEIQNLWNPNAPAKGAQKLNLTFRQPNVLARAFIDRGASGNVSAVLDAVVGHEGFLVGAEAGYDVNKAAITRYSAAVGYTAPTYTASITGTQNLSVIAAAFYQKVNANVEAGAKATYDTQGSNNVGVEVAGKYKIDPTSFAKAKINDRGIAALAYNTKVNSGTTLGLGLSLDTAKLNEAGHKIGTSLTFEG
ncbi:Mitochondrial outer membrane protein porin [Sphaceloma murrayae]|uniref:Mitochondrial outer membrane protein porin n=1 Tax=Sphaceloma murrayae TaxID=2082308 RepID=A0A2K1QG07_9PEZI|nr:Mitochondrial outer membrane protein porin [Sphaceloma murrayae]